MEWVLVDQGLDFEQGKMRKRKARAGNGFGQGR